MGKKPNDTGAVPATSSEPTALELLASMADTTWRMFVPTLPLIALGNWADTTYSTKPFFMLAGALVGGAVAALLVKKQLKGKT